MNEINLGNLEDKKKIKIITRKGTKTSTKFLIALAFLFLGGLVVVTATYPITVRKVIDVSVGDRSFKTLIYYPRKFLYQPRNLPAVIYSHGIMSCGFDVKVTIDKLVENGYVVIALDHRDIIKACHVTNTNLPAYILSTNSDFPISNILKYIYKEDHLDVKAYKSYILELQHTPLAQQVVAGLLDYTEYRVDDIQAAYSEVNNLNSSGLVFPQGLINEQKIGLMGYSIGGASMLKFWDRNKEFQSKAILLREPTLHPDFADFYSRAFIGNDKLKIFLGGEEYANTALARGMGLIGRNEEVSTENYDLPNTFLHSTFENAKHITLGETICQGPIVGSLSDCEGWQTISNNLATETLTFFDLKLR